MLWFILASVPFHGSLTGVHVVPPLHSPANEHQTCFRVLTLRNHAPVNVCFSAVASTSLGVTHRCAVAGLRGILAFDFFRNFWVFLNSCTVLHPDQQCTKVLTSLHLCQHLLGSNFFIVGSRMGRKQPLVFPSGHGGLCL